MSRVFVTSDLHFGHVGIQKYNPWENYDSILERDHAILDAIDSTNPTRRDQLIVVGDFLMHTTLHPEIAKRWENLPYMRKRLILGNHDVVHTVFHYFDDVEAYLEKKYIKRNYLFSHMPVMDDYSSRWDVNIHGHDHVNAIRTATHFNVNQDARRDKTPLTMDQIHQEIDSLKQRWSVYD